MSLCWFLSLLVIVSVAPFAVAVVTLLQQGDALLAAALMVVFLISVIAILMRMLKNPPEDLEVDQNEEGLSVALAASESPPAYDIVIKSPPPYMSYPGHRGFAYSVPAVYYCYCGSTDAATAASSCKLCSNQTHVPYSLHLSQDTIISAEGKKCHTEGSQASADPFLPSYSEAVKVYTIGRDECTHL